MSDTPPENAATARDMARGLQLALDTTPAHSTYAWVNPDGLREVIAFLRGIAEPTTPPVRSSRGAVTLPTSVQAAFLSRMTESEFQDKIIDWAKLNGWMHYHTHNSQRSPSGFPDLVLIRPPEVIFAELKAEKKYPTPKQRIWLASLQACGLETFLWRPSDWTEIENRLRRRR